MEQTLKKQTFIFILLFLLLFACTTSLPLVEKALLPANSVEEYNKLASSLQNGDTEIDFEYLRILSSSLSSYDPFAEDSKVAELRSAAASAAQADFQKKIAALFPLHCANPDFHAFAEEYFTRQGEEKKARFHQLIRDRLIASIMQVKKGASTEDAFRIVTIREAYIVLEELQLAPADFRLLERNGKHWEVFQAKNVSGEKALVYFDIEIIYRRLQIRYPG
jgi:hypothetical protein